MGQFNYNPNRHCLYLNESLLITYEMLTAELAPRTLAARTQFGR